MQRRGRVPQGPDAAQGRQAAGDFVEGMACAGGCLAGPATLYELQKSKKVFEARMDAAPDNIRDNVAEKGCAADVHRHV